MSTEHIAELLRVVNVVLSMAAASLLIVSYVHNHDRGVHRPEDPWLIVLMLCATYGSGEAAVQDAPLGLRVGLWLLGTLGLTVALTKGARSAR